MPGQQQRPNQGQESVQRAAETLTAEDQPGQPVEQRRDRESQQSQEQSGQQWPLHQAQRSTRNPPQQARGLVQTDVAGQHQQQAGLSRGHVHLPLDVGGRGPQGELHRAMGAGLGAGQTQNTVPVVVQVGRMGAQRTTRRGQSLAIGRSAFEAGIAAATAAAGADLGAELEHRQLREEPVHPANGAEIAAPKALLKAQ